MGSGLAFCLLPTKKKKAASTSGYFLSPAHQSPDRTDTIGKKQGLTPALFLEQHVDADVLWLEQKIGVVGFHEFCFPGF